MTENEIKSKLEVLKEWVGNDSLTRKDCQNAIDGAIQLLEEIQQYRTIGTVKEIKIREAQVTRLAEGYLNDLTLLREYQLIGTVEEFKALKEKNETLKALYEDARKEGNNLIIKARTEAITEFAERVKEVYSFTILELERLDEIAGQMKEGVKDA